MGLPACRSYRIGKYADPDIVGHWNDSSSATHPFFSFLGAAYRRYGRVFLAPGRKRLLRSSSHPSSSVLPVIPVIPVLPIAFLHPSLTATNNEIRAASGRLVYINAGAGQAVTVIGCLAILVSRVCSATTMGLKLFPFSSLSQCARSVL